MEKVGGRYRHDMAGVHSNGVPGCHSREEPGCCLWKWVGCHLKEECGCRLWKWTRCHLKETPECHSKEEPGCCLRRWAGCHSKEEPGSLLGEFAGGPLLGMPAPYPSHTAFPPPTQFGLMGTKPGQESCVSLHAILLNAAIQQKSI